MPDYTFRVQHFAQFEDATITFGDLTVLVGPQATGKSLLLQLFKLAQDAPAIKTLLKRYGAVLKTPAQWAEAYFGEGFAAVWNEETRWYWDGQSQTLAQVSENTGKGEQRVFYVPAQRALIFHQASWPRPFSDFRWQDPFVVRHFSDQVRLLLDAGLGGEEGVLFPKQRRLHRTVRARLEHHIFRGATLKVVVDRGQKRLMLELPHGERLPYLSWSTGQREFTPLLLGIYWLLPLGRQNRRPHIRWVVVEEPEMGLHPYAIADVLLLALELLRRGYKVIMSTHTPAVLDLLWAWKFIKQAPRNRAPLHFCRLFDLEKSPHADDLADMLWQKTFGAYFFQPEAQGYVRVQDISSLEVLAEDEALASWGHLTTFSGRAGDVVADIVAGVEGA